jgi:hypothetical protein
MHGDDVKLDSLRRAEFATVGAAMAGEFEEVRKAGITAKTFYFPAPRRVFAVVEKLDAEGRAADELAVADVLAGEVLDGEQADEAVAQMGESYTSKALLPAFIEEVATGFRRREETREARGLIQALEDGDAGEIAAARARLVECSKAGAAGRGLVLVSDSELVARNSPAPVELVNGMLAVGELALLAAPAKAGKSWFLLQMAKAIASGGPFLGKETRQGAVVYVNSEVGEVAWERRSRFVNEAMGIDPPLLFHACTRGQEVTLSNIVEQLKSGMETAGLAKVAAIVIDPFYSLAGGIDENAAGEVAAVMLGLQKLAEEVGAAVIVAHHTGKGDAGSKGLFDRPRGSTAFGGSVDTFMSLTAARSGDGRMVLEVGRRHGPSLGKRMLQFEFPIWYDVGEAEPDTAGVGGVARKYTVESIMGAFALPDEIMSPAEIMERTGMGRTRTFELLKEGLAIGRLRKVEGGYGIAGEGVADDD